MRERVANRFRLLGVALGEGTYGLVEEAVDEVTGEHVAVKFARPKFVNALKKEAAVLARVTPHPYIISLRYPSTVQVAGESGEVSEAVVLELAEGGEFFEYIVGAERPPLEELRRHFAQLLRAVAHVHQRGVCHLDIKPENVLLTSQNELKLCDFGLACVCQSATGANLLMRPTRVDNPVCYNSPEMLRGVAFDGMAADVWACGVVLFVMLTGRFPFLAARPEDRHYRRLLAGSYRYPDGVPRMAQDVFDRVLADEPDERPTVEELLRHPFLTGVQLLRTPPTALPSLESRAAVLRAWIKVQQAQARRQAAREAAGSGAARAVAGMRPLVASAVSAAGTAATGSPRLTAAPVSRMLQTDFTAMAAVGSPPVFQETTKCATRVVLRGLSTRQALEVVRQAFERASVVLMVASAFRMHGEVGVRMADLLATSSGGRPTSGQRGFDSVGGDGFGSDGDDTDGSDGAGSTGPAASPAPTGRSCVRFVAQLYKITADVLLLELRRADGDVLLWRHWFERWFASLQDAQPAGVVQAFRARLKTGAHVAHAEQRRPELAASTSTGVLAAAAEPASDDLPAERLSSHGESGAGAPVRADADRARGFARSLSAPRLSTPL